MAQARVKQYRFRGCNGADVLLNFTELQARACGGVLEPDGLSLDKAIGLVAAWNLLGNKDGYFYSIPFIKQG